MTNRISLEASIATAPAAIERREDRDLLVVDILDRRHPALEISLGREAFERHLVSNCHGADALIVGHRIFSDASAGIIAAFARIELQHVKMARDLAVRFGWEGWKISPCTGGLPIRPFATILLSRMSSSISRGSSSDRCGRSRMSVWTSPEPSRISTMDSKLGTAGAQIYDIDVELQPFDVISTFMLDAQPAVRQAHVLPNHGSPFFAIDGRGVGRYATAAPASKSVP